MTQKVSKADLAWPGVGVLLVAVGVLLPMGHVGGLVVRWAGLAMLLVFAYKRRSLTPWIFVAMMVGAEIGFDAPLVAVKLGVFSDIFLRLIKTIVAPLIFAMLAAGIAGHGDLKSVGRMGLKALIYFEVVTTLALVIGLVAINLTKAGVGLAAASSGSVAQIGVATVPHWDDFLLHVFPENIAKSVAEGQMLQVAVFAIFFGIALTMVSEAKRAPMLRLLESLGEVMFKFTNIVMYFAPIGVCGAMAFAVGHMGVGVLVILAKLVLTLYGALVVFAVAVMLPAALLFGVPVRRFLKHVAEPAAIAFATGASEAALPTALEQMEALGVPRRIVAFVIPAGYSFNLDGSTLYLAVASVALAQAAGMHLSLGTQVVMMLTMMVTSKGVAGVPKSVMVVLLATAATFNLPVAPIGVLLGVDVLLDMARTVINVTGNCLASVIVAKWVNQFETEKPSPAVLEGASM